MSKKNLKITSTILSATLMISLASFTVFAESQIYTNEDPNSTEGQYFTAEDPRGIGEFTDKEIKDGLEKSDMACEVIAIRKKSISNSKSVTAKDIAKVKDYIKKYAPDSVEDDYISKEKGDISVSAIGDWQSKNLHLPGEVQEYGNYCAPASIQAILKHKGLSKTQTELAKLCGIVPNGSGTILYKVAPALNYYNKASGRSNLSYKYYTLLPSAVQASEWNVKMADSAIATIVGNYGVVYDVHQVKGSAHYLQGYSTMVSGNIYHYVAGEGFDSSDPSNRICYYYDSNNLKDNLGDRHMHVTFQTMGVLTNDMGLVY
ncbi:C39 family peptidase [Petroclostridium sp. X23]|uniref:C39 family peptidase n=1 Tax=Petroclostridium sp. X23 TaxID=3045146 RepID=UPI0024AC93A2|nr:C39 family peptidase [Petroclostridium sp. X23]WHH57662.1 C39 family peptidase [Petroclostridium sp. X23]